ncbi:MAG: T9SS type A sorting domain-containing protein [Bacteroidetes bacterium]|nr:T9SS type A sorting domain-containing protein [Bacteroidota bacterium]
MTAYNPDDLRFAENNIVGENNTAAMAHFSIYPVPSASTVTIDLLISSGAVANLFVTDLSGKQIANWMVDQIVEPGTQQFQFDVSNLASGMYIAVFKTADEMQTTKFVVQH